MGGKVREVSESEIWGAAFSLVRRFGEDATDLSALAVQYLRMTGNEDLSEVSRQIHDAIKALLDLGMSEAISLH